MEELQTFKGHTGRVWNVSWNSDGNTLASCGEDKTIRLYTKENSSPVKFGLRTILTDGHDRTIRSTAWSPCGKYMASASFDSTVAIWLNNECTATLEGHENEVKSVTWSSSGQYLATCSRDKSVWIWERIEEDEYECAIVLNAHTQDVKKVTWHPDSNILASASYDNTIKIYKMDDEGEWICLSTLSSHESTVWSICFDKSGERLASCADDKTVKIWQQYCPINSGTGDDPTWKCVCTISGYHQNTIYDISWCHLTNMIATACADNAIRLFKEDINSDKDSPTFSLVSSYTASHSQDVNSVAWNPTIAGILASASDDGTVKLWTCRYES